MLSWNITQNVFLHFLQDEPFVSSGQSHILRTKGEVDGTALEPKVRTWPSLQEVKETCVLTSENGVTERTRNTHTPSPACHSSRDSRVKLFPALCGNPATLQSTGLGAAEDKSHPHSHEGSSDHPHTARTAWPRCPSNRKHLSEFQRDLLQPPLWQL